MDCIQEQVVKTCRELMLILNVSPGSSASPVFLPGYPACEGVLQDGGVSGLAEGPRVRPAEIKEPQRDQQDPGSQALADHQGAHTG